MTNQHPITPPPDLVQQWASEKCYDKFDCLYELHIATRAAQWVADQELEACVKWLEWNHSDLLSRELHAARRPKPLSLKEQAYAALDAYIYGNPDHNDKQNTYNIIRQALEQLDD